MAFRAQEPGETNQQYDLRSIVSRFTERWFQPQELKNENGFVYFVIPVGEGTTQDSFDRFTEALYNFEQLIENPPGGIGFFTWDTDCFEANAAAGLNTFGGWAQYQLRDCESYFRQIEQAAAELLDASNDLSAEQTAWLDSSSVGFSEDLPGGDGGVSETEILESIIDQQTNIFDERDDILEPLKSPAIPAWLYLVGAGLLVLAVNK